MANRYLVVSDLHLADIEDHSDGWKAYKHSSYLFDGEFAGLLRRFVDRSGKSDDLTLVLNGDILDFDVVTAVPDDPPWPVSRLERRHGLEPTEDRSAWKVRRILRDHPQFVSAIAGFLAGGHRVVYVMGNHDREFHFQGVRDAFRDVVAEAVGEAWKRVSAEALRFEPWFYWVKGEIYAEHGHQYDYYSSFRHLLCPVVGTRRGKALALPMGNLSNRYLVTRMGFFNPHAVDFILNLFRYLAHWFRFYAFTRRSLAFNWFWGSLVTMAHLLRVKRRLRKEPQDRGETLQGLAHRFNLPLETVMALEELQRRPITDRFFRVVREFWLDRVLMALLMTGGTVALALVPIPLWIKLMVPLTAFPLFYFVYEALVKGEDVFTHERQLPIYARRIAALLKVRVVTFGHTHKPRLIPLDKDLTFVDTGTWAPIMRRMETWRLDPGYRDYLTLTIGDNEAIMDFNSWHFTGLAVRRVEGDKDLARCRAIRREVFIDEQGVSEEEEWDGLDGECTHFLALAGTRPVGTARLRVTPESEARAQRVAVLKTRRGRNIGRHLMDAMEQVAREAGHTELVLEGQVQAIPFYEKIGYRAEGAEFLDAGIPHRLMRKALMVDR
ncbi:MAG: GNAT family N-acetyltransferase [Deltaproteobacteria bacterium]|nr:GNAT family N-acetyltransferase [Deltaproteobacteria bacterium]